MFSAKDREKSHGIQYKQEWAGDTEKVSHHQVCCPRRLQFRETVKHIKSVPAFFFNNIVDLHGECLKLM